MFRDHHVSFRSLERLQDLAQNCRATAATSIGLDGGFGAAEYIEKLLLGREVGDKGPLFIEFYDRDFPQDDPAFVTYGPLTLHVDNQVWIHGKQLYAYANEILTHEIAHILLHDASAQAFSNDEGAQIEFGHKVHSAEWQAVTFTDHVLAPDDIVAKLNDAGLIETVCNVLPALARRRLREVREMQSGSSLNYHKEICPGCGNVTLVPRGSNLECESCLYKCF